MPDENSRGYCQARARTRLELSQPQEAHEHLMQWFAGHNAPESRLCRQVRVLDVCGVFSPLPDGVSPTSDGPASLQPPISVSRASHPPACSLPLA